MSLLFFFSVANLQPPNVKKISNTPGTSTFWPGDSASLSAFAASQVAASSERRENGRNWVSQAVSSSCGSKKAEEEGEEVGVEDADADEGESPSSLGTALAKISDGLSALATRRIDPI